MTAIKGYPSKNRDLRLSSEDIHITAEPVRALQQGMSVVSHQFVREVGTDVIAADSTITEINVDAHEIQVGDIIRFTSGNLAGREVKAMATTANTVVLAETLSEPPAETDEIQVLRHKYPLLNADGTIPFGASAGGGPIEFNLNSTATEVNKETATPANNIPLPVELIDTTGVVDMRQGVSDLADISTNTDSIYGELQTLVSRIAQCDTDSVTITSSVLPTGAATETTLASIDGKITAVDTGAVVISSSALPTGAATAVNQASILAELQALNINQHLDVSAFVRNDYSSVNVTTGAYVELIASTSAAVKKLQIFDSSGQTLKIAFGAAASEVDKFLIFPGGNGDIEVTIPAGTRISIQAVSASATVGEISINLLG